MAKFYVLTGAPSCGKSSIILALEERGEEVVREAAEDIIKIMKARGIGRYWEVPDFQDMILDLQMKREARARDSRSERVFLDRGLIDGFAFYNLRGQTPSRKLTDAIENGRMLFYEKILIVERLDFCERNYTRQEEIDYAKLERMHTEDYRARSYPLGFICKGSVDERVEMILREIESC